MTTTEWLLLGCLALAAQGVGIIGGKLAELTYHWWRRRQQ